MISVKIQALSKIEGDGATYIASCSYYQSSHENYLTLLKEAKNKVTVVSIFVIDPLEGKGVCQDMLFDINTMTATVFLTLMSDPDSNRGNQESRSLLFQVKFLGN